MKITSKVRSSFVNDNPSLGLFSLGTSYFLYSFMQYLLMPICWWLSQHIDSLAWMNDVFYYFESANLDPFSMKSFGYSLIGIAAFFVGYRYLPARKFRFKNKVLARKWEPERAEQVFWLFFLCGLALKALKVFAGVAIEDVVAENIKHSYFTNPLIVFYLSFNWFNLIALIVINVAYQEARKANHLIAKRLKITACIYSLFFILISLTTGGKSATFMPLFGLLIVRQYYSIVRVSLLKYVFFLVLLIGMVFAIKLSLASYFESGGSSQVESLGLRFALFYILFFRVNLSYVLLAVIERGQQAFPEGTLSQFWVEMTPYGLDKINIFDGNEFGRAIGVAPSWDHLTGIASTNMGDWFINYGLWGIVFGMFVTGIVYKCFLSNCQQRLPLFVMLYALMWPILIHGMESPVSVLFATSIKMISLCIIVHIAITKKFSS